MDIVYVFFRGHEVNKNCIDPQLNLSEMKSSTALACGLAAGSTGGGYGR